MPEPARLARALLTGAVALFAGLASVLPSSAPAAAGECTEFTIEAERKYGLPPGLLLSVALVESGMGGVPQAYAINQAGRSIHASSMDEARSYIRDGNGRLRSNTMVGCMQISLTHHKDQFKPVERILEPQSNVFYAAGYLKRLHQQTGNWTAAVGRYQGGNRKQRLAYVCRIHDNLAALNPESAAILDTAHCPDAASPPSIAPETRRKFRSSQVASAEAIY